MQKKILNLSSVLLYLLPFTFILGPLITEFVILITSILVIYLIVKNNEFYLIKNNFFYFFGFIYIILLLSSLFSEFPLYSLKSSAPYFRWIFYLITIYYLSIKNLSFLKNFTFSFLICFFIFLFDSYIQLLFNKNIFGYEILVSNRISSFFKDELILGGFIFKIIPIILYYLFFYNNEFKYKKILFIFILLSAFSLIFLSGERSSTYLFILYFISFSLFFYKKIFREIKYISIFILIFLSGIYFFNENYKGRMFDNFYNSLTNKIDHKHISKSKFKNFSVFSFVHEKHITSAYLMFRKGNLKTKLIGIGPKNFRNLCSNMRYCDYENCCSTHPHNIVAQILSETGLIGFLILIGVYLYLIKLFLFQFLNFVKSKKNLVEYSNIFLLLGILFSIFPLTTSGNFFHNKYSILLYTLLGIYFASLKLAPKIK